MNPESRFVALIAILICFVPIVMLLVRLVRPRKSVSLSRKQHFQNEFIAAQQSQRIVTLVRSVSN
jgi:predicted membrane-bound spermidine synthase